MTAQNNGLIYPADWKFEGLGIEIPNDAQEEFFDLLLKISDGRKSTVESFKHALGSPNISTSMDWAQTDLRGAISSKANNAALFLDGIWRGIKAAEQVNHLVPSVTVLNGILHRYSVPLEIAPPNLIRTDAVAVITEQATSGEGSTPGTQGHTFNIGERIGAGGYGVVYKATRSTTVGTFEFALKVLDPSPFVTDYQKAVLRFRREIAALQSLQHRAIVQYFEAGISEDKKPYIVMPYIEGKNLREAAEFATITRRVTLLTEVLRGIAYAHSKDVLHRDLKPTNIIVRRSDDQPVILDFGSAYLLDQMDSNTLTTQSVGTLGYIPSEILIDPSRRSKLQDVYACGMILYEIFAGRRPDPVNYSPLANIDSDLGVLDPVIRKAIAGEAERFDSAQAFLDALMALRI